MPTSVEKPVAPTTAHHGTAGGGKCGIIFAASTPKQPAEPDADDAADHREHHRLDQELHAG